MDIMFLDAKTMELKELEVENELKTLQDLVGGYIEAPVLSDDLDKNDVITYINEEGKLIDLPASGAMLFRNGYTDIIKGNIVFTGTDNEGDNIDLTNEQKQLIYEVCSNTCFTAAQHKEIILFDRR